MTQPIPERGSERPGPLLHIGYPKCASTFLQKRLFPGLRGWTYFDKVIPDSKEFLRRLRFEDLAKSDGATLASIEQAWRSRVIFSREHVLSSWAKGELQALQNLAYFTKTFAAEPTVLVVIRRQDNWVFSEFKFKHTLYRQPDNVIAHVKPLFLDYAALDSLLRERFGFRNIVYYPYEKLVGSDGFKTFASDILGETLDEGFDPGSRVNESPRLAMAGYQFRAMQFLGNRIPGLARLLPRREITIPAEKRAEILARYQASNASFSKQNDLGLERYGYF